MGKTAAAAETAAAASSSALTSQLPPLPPAPTVLGRVFGWVETLGAKGKANHREISRGLRWGALGLGLAGVGGAAARDLWKAQEIVKAIFRSCPDDKKEVAELAKTWIISRLPCIDSRVAITAAVALTGLGLAALCASKMIPRKPQGYEQLND